MTPSNKVAPGNTIVRASETDLPLVSIVTPILNGAEYLDGCIQSVLGQNYHRIEHIFVDGGSTDGTIDMLTTYAQKHHGRVRIVFDPGTGPGEAWGRGLKIARGEIFGCLGVDDIYVPGAITTVIDFFQTNQDAFFVHGGCDIIDEHGKLIVQHKVGEFDFRKFVNTADHIATPSAFYRRVVLERVGWLDPSGNDFDLMIRIASQFQIYGLKETLSKLRIREGSAFNPTDFRKRLDVYARTYHASRKYGGQWCSPIAFRYYAGLIVDRLHMSAFFPSLRKMYSKLRSIARTR